MPEIIVIAHNIRSTHNIGSIFRTCDGFGVSKLILSGYTPYPKVEHDPRLPHIAEKLTNQIHKTALGAEELVTFEYLEDILNVLDELKLQQIPIIALEQAPNSQQLRGFVAPARFALLLGEEVHGITDEILQKCDHIVEIPMHGQKESFNVSVATGIALYALL